MARVLRRLRGVDLSSYRRLPWAVRAPIRRLRNASAAAIASARQWQRWRAIYSTAPRMHEHAVSYGVESMPDEAALVFGGAVKFRLLHGVIPNAARDFNLLYLGSSSMPVDAATLVWLARRRNAPFVWNQNGVAYAAWYGDGWQQVNRPRARLLHEADHVVYQSAFCKLGADRFYGERQGPWEILPNPVDTSAFVPAPPQTRPLTLLLGGNQYQRYRVERALETLAIVRVDRPDARMLVTGALSFAPDGEAQTRAMICRLGLVDAVEFVGEYSQAHAPTILQRAHILIHPKVNDPCPTIVLEAMSCGLPVAYSATGGTPELVGDEAGKGVPGILDWETDHPPAAADLAAAVMALADDLTDRAAAARARAMQFDARVWIERHVVLFDELRRRGPRLS